MKYIPETCVWEITMGCNLRCRHCGSSCNDERQDELTTEEALHLVDDIAALKIKWISLIGGEVFLRKDWSHIAKKFSDYKINVCIITNGTLIDYEIVEMLKESRVANVSISIDGTSATQNMIRGNGIYEKCCTAISLLKAAGITTSVITTVMKENIEELSQLRDSLISMGVHYWQIQPALPEGNLAQSQESIIEPQDIKRIIDFAYEVSIKGQIKIVLPDTIGYYTKKETITRQITDGTDKVPMWHGCNAGVRSFGIFCNGDITGCTSMRDPKYIEGNIRKRSLKDIWEDDDSFAWRRAMQVEQLAGKCRSCEYVETCLGGCSNVRLTTTGDINGENRYCAYSAMR